MSERAQLDHLLLDVDFFHKPTIVGFRRKFGYAAVAWLIETYCQMSRATDAIVTEDVLLATAEDMRLENGAEIVAYCLDFGLITQVDDFYTNYRVIADQEKLAKRRESDRNRKGFRADSMRKCAGIPAVPVTDTDTGSEDLDLKNNGQPTERIEIPPDATDAQREQLNAAIEALEAPSGQEWTKSPVFIGTGRRPMKKYPSIFITPHELAQVFQLYESEGVFGKLRRSLQLVESRIKTRKTHDPPVNAHAWLMGWAFTDAVSAENETTKLKANSRRLAENVR